MRELAKDFIVALTEAHIILALITLVKNICPRLGVTQTRCQGCQCHRVKITVFCICGYNSPNDQHRKKQCK